MSPNVIIGASDQVVAYEIRSLVSEVDGFAVDDVADSSDRLEESVLRRDPDIVLVHAGIGPTPVLQLVRDLAMRRPGSAILVMAEEITPEVFTEAMDAGARGVLQHPASLEDLQARLAAAAQWSAQMRRHLSSPSDLAQDAGRGRVFVVAGSKGGVGTSTLAAHLAHEYVRAVPGKSVCLVDLDVEKGDLGNLLGVTHRLDISDLAKVADDLGPSTVSSAIHRDPSGVAVLLAPGSVEDIGSVGDREARLIVGAIRRQFDLVVVDAGSHVTPVTAAAVEIADEVLLVTNPDVLSLRGVHRTLDAWGRVGVRKPETTRVVLNRVSKVADIQPESVPRLIPTPPCRTHLPAAFKRLEPGLNYRTPDEVKDRSWWNGVNALAREVGMIAQHDVAAPAARRQRRERARGGRGSRRAAAVGESGQASLEFVGVLPVLMLLVLLLWQVGLTIASLALTGHVADEAARAAAVGDDVHTALDAVPGFFAQSMTVSQGGSSVRVHTDLPILVPGFTAAGWDFDTKVGVVDEPS
ncbi:AAA family ATPase [Nocardioides mesophilus]|uniref:AAA family ATPase n=1 Tax=Nocardioides mesophilus TaxID=433659 RepID=A0A7G9REY0_9ACTN|nr:AAA family ATPase [Nocardioides mesophilus]QNN54155.1 AAA family ATPase [Nocardioides mesophilus]